MGKFESFAEYLNNLLGANFFVKYYSNKSVDWEAVINENTCHGSMKVIGGSNQSLKDIYTRTDDISLTFMIPEELFEERSTEAINFIIIFFQFINYFFITKRIKIKIRHKNLS